MRERTGLNVAVSAGILTAAQAQQLAAAGVHRYNHNIETARSFFPEIVTTHTWDERAETCRLVRESLDRLGEPCREIIELRYYGELRYDEIAAELHLNPKTVSSRLSKCLDRLLIIAKEIFPPDNRLPSNL